MADLHLIRKQCPQLIWSPRKPAKSLVDNGGRLSSEHLMGGMGGGGEFVWAGMLHKTKSLLISSLGMVCLTLAATWWQVWTSQSSSIVKGSHSPALSLYARPRPSKDLPTTTMRPSKVPKSSTNTHMCSYTNTFSYPHTQHLASWLFTGNGASVLVCSSPSCFVTHTPTHTCPGFTQPQDS